MIIQTQEQPRPPDRGLLPTASTTATRAGIMGGVAYVDARSQARQGVDPEVASEHGLWAAHAAWLLAILVWGPTLSASVLVLLLPPVMLGLMLPWVAGCWSFGLWLTVRFFAYLQRRADQLPVHQVSTGVVAALAALWALSGIGWFVVAGLVALSTANP